VPTAEKVVSRVPYRVLFADTDALGIVYYANYLRYFEVGRAEFFREHVRPFPDYIAEDQYLIVLEAHCTYRRPARYDQVLAIETRVGEVGRVRLRVDYTIRDEAGEILAEGYTTHTVTDSRSRVRRMSREFIAHLAKLAGGAPVR
jgi:acyl-CoA thioester hydrolase